MMKRIGFFIGFVFLCTILLAQNVGDKRSATSGSWTTIATWEEYNGSSWVAASDVPSSTDDVTILNSHTVNISTGGVDCANLTIENGAKLWTNSTTVTRYVDLNGNVVCNGTIGNGTGNDDGISFRLYGSNITFSGSGSCTIKRLYKDINGTIIILNIGMDVQVRDNGFSIENNNSNSSSSLIINILSGYKLECSGNGATPAGGYHLRTYDACNVYGTLEISGTLDNDAGTNLVVKSDAIGTGSLITSSTETATVERYIQVGTSAKNHLVSAPISDATIDDILDATLGDYNAYKYDPSLGGGINDRWLRVFSSENMTSGTGFVIPYAHASTTSKTISFAGTLNSGTVEPTISSTQDDYNLVGNPYPCSISPRAFLNENAKNNSYIYGNLHFWDESGSPSTSDYATWTFVGATKGNNGNGTTPDSIALGQAFFVQSQSGSPTKVTFTHDMKSAYSATFFTPEPDPIQRYYISITDENNAYNEILVGFTNMATTGFDNLYDAHKLKGNPNIAFYSFIDGMDREYAIQGRPYVIDRDNIKIGIDANEGGKYKIQLNRTENTADGLLLFLLDKELDRKILLDESTVYEVELAQGTISDRFELVFTYDNLLGVDEEIEEEQIQVNGSILVLSNPITKVELIDLFGRCVQYWENPGQSIDLSDYSGCYFVKIMDANQLIETRKIILP
jgi:hypothetical protein